MIDFESMFARTQVMAILRGYSVDRTVQLARTAWDLGVVCVEIPVQSRQAVDALAATVEAARGRDVFIGAGTVTTRAAVEDAARAGALFTVAPGLDEVVARASLDAGLPHLPGVATPSDIQRATRMGFAWLKAFPAAVLSPAWISAMRGPFPQVHFVATGGIDSTNARFFLDAGCHGVAVGSALESPEQLRALALLVGK
ncbi:MAG: bifunctional 4-hydroxy-2-oxoglutarate aldolase/2-dehydro-3-deoxy-phosphogluconate aldolase [Cellulomonas sp.]